MKQVSRRDFLAAAAAMTPAAALAGKVSAAEPKDVFPLGCQSYSFRKFNFEDSIKQLKKLDLDIMEFCGVHFPADAAAEGFPKVKATLADKAVKAPCFGVEGYGADAAANRGKFEFAKALGVSILTADPAPEAFDNLEQLCEEFQIKIAIHNHGPRARYDKVADTLKAVEGRHAFIGACVDTGHSIRSAEKPHEVIKALGSRVISVHLKDWKTGGEEQILGEGDMDLLAVAKALFEIKFKGPVIMEYENSPDNPVPDMKKGMANWRRAVAEARKAAEA